MIEQLVFYSSLYVFQFLFFVFAQLMHYSFFSDLSRALNAGLEALNSLESLPLASQKYSYSLVAILLYNLGKIPPTVTRH